MEQDELAEVREKIAHLPVTMPASLPKQFVGTDLADRILALTLRRGGGKCDGCKGGRKVIIIGKHVGCPTCKGTGKLPVEEKSIGDLIKEWQNGKV